MYPMHLIDDQSINSALLLCQIGAGMTFHAAKWLYIHEHKKQKQTDSNRSDPLISDVCSAMRGGHIENPDALGSLADELTGGYGLQPGTEHIWLGGRSDLSYFWKKDANGQNVSLDRSHLDFVTDPNLRAKVQSVLAQAQLEGLLALYSDQYVLTDQGRKAILQPTFVRNRLEGEARFYDNAAEGLGGLQTDRIDRKLEELGLTDRFVGCDRVTLNKEKLLADKDEQTMRFYVPGTHRKKQLMVPGQDVIELDKSTYAVFLRKDIQYLINGQPTAEKDVFRLFDNKNRKQAADFRAAVSKAEAAAKKEIELNGKKLYVLQNGVAKEHTVTRVWTSPDGAHLHLQPADRNHADLLLPENAIGKLAFPTAAEATAYLKTHPQDVEVYSVLLQEQEMRGHIPSFTVPQERVTAVGDSFEVQTDAPYERVIFKQEEIQLLENGTVRITPGDEMHTVRTGNVSYEVTGQGARELAGEVKRTAEPAKKMTQKTAEKTAEAVAKTVPSGTAGAVAKATVKGASKSVELMQYAANLADGTADTQLPSRVARLVQKL